MCFGARVVIEVYRILVQVLKCKTDLKCHVVLEKIHHGQCKSFVQYFAIAPDLFITYSQKHLLKELLEINNLSFVTLAEHFTFKSCI